MLGFKELLKQHIGIAARTFARHCRYMMKEVFHLPHKDQRNINKVEQYGGEEGCKTQWTES